MGLDTVELVLAFEEEFGITIKDEDAEKLTTPGAVANYVMSRVRTNASDPCPSQAGFYRIRSRLMTAFSMQRKEIHLHSSLHQILKGDIRRNWEKLRAALEAEHLPKLKRTKILFYTFVFAIPAAIVSPMISAGIPLSAIMAAFCILVFFENALSVKMGTVLPSHIQTVAALIPYVGCASSVIWTREMVLSAVIKVTSEKLGISIDKINENSHFVHDLGAD